MDPLLFKNDFIESERIILTKITIIYQLVTIKSSCSIE